MEIETHQQSEADFEGSKLLRGQRGRPLSGCQQESWKLRLHTANEDESCFRAWKYSLGVHSEVLMTLLFQTVLLCLFLIEVCVPYVRNSRYKNIKVSIRCEWSKTKHIGENDVVVYSSVHSLSFWKHQTGTCVYFFFLFLFFHDFLIHFVLKYRLHSRLNDFKRVGFLH